ncbi:hypothetical protein CFK37_08660 [Virgibacillus phasianinus]|uniref:Glycoside hydrolase 123 catalytic domain-containing protein n=1 Tax=Virgibacillus phasianinus TaxID=2017483 RepID=A0A220U2D6_9BACI|nr:DUF4091 domain-containing protein [Virgibacillus phasianinus]ASK62227.1 hypothetical protein CFK37_08660 [Virgibacillus phasianinus]
MPEFETRCLSSLIKVFPDEELTARPFNQASALWNEAYSFQVAYRQKGNELEKVTVRAEGTIGDVVTMRTVGLVPSNFPCYKDHDEDVLRVTPGLYPDPLYRMKDRGLPVAPSNQWRSVWITVNLDEKIQAGSKQINVLFEKESGELLGEEVFDLEVIPASLPEQQLICTQWFHADCLATHYNVDIFSEEHWERIDQYMQTAAEHGSNMLLTPLFTPPLDTDIGGVRPTVQLVEVEKTGETYQFNFAKLTRWIELCLKHGIRYVEFSHLFTQWGAEHAPKIVAKVNGETNRIFGWETDASGHEYKEFLSQFLPELITYIKEQGLEDRVYFHVSDEPSQDNLESYQQASDLIHDYLSDFPVIDALSDYAFYDRGLVKNPIPANDHLVPFLENNVPNLWTYYCCVQYKKVSNRFFAFPSARNRISGMQFYHYNIAGFLHWGYNFWYSRLSRKQIDPFQNTDADGGFPSGDAFLVYPGENGPIESIRMEVFYEALQDLRALQLLEKLIRRAEVLNLLGPITFEDYPRGSEWLLTKREKVNQKILEAIE